MKPIDLFKILGTIAIQNGEANKSIDDTADKAKGASKDVEKFGDEGDKTESKLSKAFSKIGSAAVKVGKVIGEGIAVGTVAMGKLTMSALNAAGELEQNMGGSEAVFKQYASNIQKVAADAYKNMGLSQSDFLATANKMGALFQGSGFTIKESMDMTSQAMQRAADVASIMGLDTSSAMEAVAGAAKGNFTMMDNLGVAINDTTLQIYAQEKGLGKLETTQDKVGAAMQMFLEKTAYATGNYKKENETLAGSLSTAKAAFDNFLSGAGGADQLAESFTNAAHVIIKNLNEIFPRLVSGITELINKLVPEMPGLLQNLLPGIIEGAIQLVNGLVAAMPAVVSVLMDCLPMLIDGVMQIADGLIGALPQIIEAITSALPDIIPQLVDGVVNLVLMLVEMLPQIIQPIIDNLPMIITSIVTALIENLPALIDGAIQLALGVVGAADQIIQTLVPMIPTIIVQVAAAIIKEIPTILSGVLQITSSIVTTVKDWYSSWISGFASALGLIINKVGEFFTKIIAQIKEWLVAILEPIAQKLKEIWEAVKDVFEKIKDVIQTAFMAIVSIIEAAFDIITLPFRLIWENCKEYVFEAWEWIKEKVSAAINAVKDVIETVMTAISDFLKPILEAIKSFFENIWNGIVNFIKPILDTIKNAISTAFNAVKTTVTNVLNDVKSFISNVFNSIKSTVQGILDGIKSAVSTAFEAVKTSIEKPINAAKDVVQKGLDAIKGFFSKLQLKFPNIKLPHFKVSGKLSIDPPSVPHLSIEWYKKAYDNPLVLNNPSIFGYNPSTNSFMGGGDDPSKGPEVVSGANTLMDMFQNAVTTGNSFIEYCLDKILYMLAELLDELPGWLNIQLVADDGTILAYYAPKLDDKLGEIKEQKDRGR